MIVAFLEGQTVGSVVEPPKHAHITIKKKFKLLDINEEQLVRILRNNITLRGKEGLRLGGSKAYDSEANMIIEVLNPNPWIALHTRIVELLGSHIESRDPGFEGVNYLPHVTWKLRGETNINPNELMNRTFKIPKLYLIQRIDPIISKARIVAIIDR